jgi:hypothetical protein
MPGSTAGPLIKDAKVRYRPTELEALSAHGVRAFVLAMRPLCAARIDSGMSREVRCLSEDTGYAPVWDIERAAADYIGWLRAGQPPLTRAARRRWLLFSHRAYTASQLSER